MKYSISLQNQAQHIFKIRTGIECEPGGMVRLEVSHWRPGRYENASYPQKITDTGAFSESGETLPVTRINSHIWEIGPVPSGKGYFEHCFFATEKNAGSSFLDDVLIYINPINLLLFNRDKINEACELELELPSGFAVASSLLQKGNVFYARDYHEMADSPILAAKELAHYEYQVNQIPFHLWFWGDVRLDAQRLISEFSLFTQTQLDLFGGFPVREYHFLFLILPVPYHHGVEHEASTVIVMGPGYNFTDGIKYDDFLGVSSHELFHTWNVKSIRPREMQPYDYSRETYSHQHYITEGLTTYYGDLMLLRSKVWSLNTFLREFNDSNSLRHFATAGGDFISLRQASFESWINGYQDGMPNRKISFYSKGAIVAFLLDQEILSASKNKFCLDHVMREMYERFGKTKTGYSETDFWQIVEKYTGQSSAVFQANFINGTASLEAAMNVAAERLGLSWMNDPKSYQGTLGIFGFSWQMLGARCIVTNVMPGSPAADTGLAKDDELIALGHRKIENNLNEIAAFLGENTDIEIHYFSSQRLKSGKLKRLIPGKPPLFVLKALSEPNEKQKENLMIWIRGIV